MAPLPDSILALLPRSLQPREPTIASDVQELGLSPMEVYSLHRRADSAGGFVHGQGSKPATDFNNQGFIALFALIGAGMVITSIWFFFWAKNGGFKFQNGDWDDYKSTVLRRKGPDGRTLSNATKSTKLGGGSIFQQSRGDLSSVAYTDSTGYTDKDEMREVDRRNGIRGGGGRNHRSSKSRNKDPELADYRQEKAARVGGMNRQHDGSYFDYSNTEPSEVSRAPLMGEKKLDKKERARLEKEKKQKEKDNAKKAKEDAKATAKAEAAQKKKEAAEKKKSKSSAGPAKPSPVVLAEPVQPMRAVPNTYTFSEADDDNRTVYSGAYTAGYTEYTSHTRNHSHHSSPSHGTNGSYYDAYRPRNSTRESSAPDRTNSPRKPRIVQPSGEWRSQADSDMGTKSYPCHIPGLSTAGSVAVSDSVSQAGARRDRKKRDGYRRAGRGRRDSLSDSE